MSQEKIRELRTEYHCILYTIEQQQIKKLNNMNDKQFNEYLANKKVEQEELIYKLKNKI